MSRSADTVGYGSAERVTGDSFLCFLVHVTMSDLEEVGHCPSLLKNSFPELDCERKPSLQETDCGFWKKRFQSIEGEKGAKRFKKVGETHFLVNPIV